MTTRRLPTRRAWLTAVLAMGIVAAAGPGNAAEGTDFERVVDRPVVKPTVGFYDDYMIASPSVIEVDGVLHMVYAGHCQKPAGYTPLLPDRMKCPEDAGIFLLGATSTDGISWVKEKKPVLESNPNRGWMSQGVAEAELVYGPDGWYYLFFTGLGRDESRAIGVARSQQPFGPWDVSPRPILKGNSSRLSSTHKVLAPGIMIEPDRNRVLMWFNGTNRAEVGWDVYVAEGPWPIKTDAGWATFSRANGGDRAVVGPYDAGSGDGTVIFENGTYYMFFTCGSPEMNGPPGICMGTSQDGYEFTYGADPHVLDPRAGKWDENLETAFIMRNPRGAGYWMYYAGYLSTGYEGTSIGLASAPTLTDL